MRCYFLAKGHITGVHMLNADTDEGRISQAKTLFEKHGKQVGAEGFEVWDGSRFVFRHPPDLEVPKAPDADSHLPE